MHKENKKIFSIRARESVIYLLNKLCEQNSRSQANQIEQLIIGAAKQAGIKTKS